MAESLPDLLAENGIRLKRLTAGHNEHIRCPRCEGGNTKEPSLSVTIDADGSGAAWVCHRGSCGWTGGGKVRSGEQRQRPVDPPRVVQKPQSHTPAQKSNRPQWLWEFFDARNIGAKTVEHFGIYATPRRFPEPVGESPAIVFPFLFRGELVNRKYRPHPAKNPMGQDKDALPTLFNVDALGATPAEIVWVEGEIDVMAMHEAGITNAVTLKDGAPAKAGDGFGKRLDALNTHADLLTDVPKIVLAGDMDGPGMALREELAQRLGRHRCWLVTWPEGCKDASDVLQRHGPEAVQAAVAAAQRYPIEGLHRIAPGQLVSLRDRPPPATMTTGVRSVDRVLKLPAEGRLIVVTGFPSSGKTSYVRFVMVHTAAEHGRRWAVFSPEMQPWEMFMAQCAEVYIGQPFWPEPGWSRMTDEEAGRAEAWLSDRVSMLVSDAEDNPPTLDWLLDRARYSVLRDGTTDLLIDPWNELDHVRGDASETDYIGRALQRLKSFGLRHGVNIWIIAHPAKPTQLRPGEKRGPPGPYDIAASAHWANKTDLGLTVHQTDGKVDLLVWKARFRRWGTRGQMAPMDFEPVTGRYSDPFGDDDPGPIFRQPAGGWLG